MRPDDPSLTAAGVAVARSLVQRTATPTGDPQADERLTDSIARGWADRRPSRARRSGGRRDFLGYIDARTKFFDEAVLRAIDDGIRQVVILGAGYDGRALRFRTPGVQFFEVDHPATQRDKRERLTELDIACDDVVFVAADFTESTLDDALARAGHDATIRTLFTCEGVLRYLPEDAFRGLLATTAKRAAPGSRLAASVSTREATTRTSPDRKQRVEHLAAIGEPVLTVPDRETALSWLVDAGWTGIDVDTVSRRDPGTRPGRLLVLARPG